MTNRARGSTSEAIQLTSADINVRVLAFARVRELLGFGERDTVVGHGATIETVWSDLVRQVPQLAELRPSLRFARNGTLAPASTPVHEGDEIALLPPVGGG